MCASGVAASISAIATSSMPSSASTLTRSSGSWLRSVPLARFMHGNPAALNALASDPPPVTISLAHSHMRAARVRRADRGAVGFSPVAGEHLLDGQVEVALGGVSGVLEAVDHLGHDLFDPLLGDAAHLGLDAAALGHDVRRGAALDDPDVRGRLVVQRPSRIAAIAAAAAAIALRPSSGRMPGMGGPPRSSATTR